MKRAASVLALLLLTSCTGPRPTQEDYITVVRQVIAFIQEDSRTHMLGRPSDGPNWVDVKGFATRARQVTGDSIPVARLMEILGKPRIADPRQVLLIDDEEQGGLGGTWVREYGNYVSPNVVRYAGNQITMIVVGYTTDRRTFPTVICDRSWRVRYRKEGGQWRRTEQELLKNCPGATP
ncbi:MAG TPA: hypothetical protein VK420_10730 [Longimicrobium sp.]|jgi:hypothetical protein|nr:hypothetical protein [Longimicrobium sp.]